MPENNKKEFNLKIFLNTRKYLLVTVAMALTSLGLLLFAIIPQFQEVLELNNQVQREKPNLDRLRSKLVELQNIQFSPEFSQMEIVESALPSKKPLLEFLTSLNTIAVANSVVVEDFSLSPGLISADIDEIQGAVRGGSQGPIDTMETEMRVTGSFAEVSSFLIDLEKISPFTTITGLSLSSRSGTDDFDRQENVMRAQIVTRSHFFTQSVAAAIEAPLPTLTARELEVLQELTGFSLVDLPEQLEITGGGLQDLFGVDPLLFE
jgi:Tfp pilus assembly protein PilO